MRSQQGNDLHLEGIALTAGRQQTEGTKHGRVNPFKRLLQQPRPEVEAWTRTRSGQTQIPVEGRSDWLYCWIGCGCGERHQGQVYILQGAGWWGLVGGGGNQEFHYECLKFEMPL